MTAVEWLYEQIDNKDMGEIPMWVYDFCNQALEMEKEQKELDYQSGFLDCYTKLNSEKLTRKI